MRTTILVIAALLFHVATVASAKDNVGFEELHIANGTEPSLTVGIWYPTKEQPDKHHIGTFVQIVAPNAPVDGIGLPLVVLSHGGGGSFESHYDVALALARAGFVAAAVSHAGDTYDDQSQALRLRRRPVQLRRLVSFMLDEWPHHDRLNSHRVGAFGFSNGGFTVLVAAGGVPNLGRTGAYCLAHRSDDLCRDLKRAGIDSRQIGADIPARAWIPDRRVKAAVVAAPAFGFAFGPKGLMHVHIPIQLWRAADDHHQPNPGYDEAVRLALPQRPEYHVVAGADHYDFLPTCDLRLAARAPRICSDPTGFDRTAFHKVFDAEIVRFFRAHLV